MSFVHFSASKRKQVKKNRKNAKESHWDSTTSDLSVHKATPEDLKLRKVLATSKNLDVVRQETEEKRLKAARRSLGSRSSCSSSSAGGAATRELMGCAEQYRSLLSKTEEALVIARDVLGDEGKRLQAYPSVTPAPTFDSASERPDGTILSHPAPPTKLEVLNSTVMQQTALNDSEAHEGETVPSADLKTSNRLSLHDISSEDTGDLSDQQGRRDATPSVIHPKIRKAALSSADSSRRRAGASLEDASSVTVAGLSSDLEKMLHDLEALKEVGMHSGRRPVPSQMRSGTFAGYTATLVHVNSELAHFLKQVSIRLCGEIAAREQLAEEVISQRRLINGLTEDLLDVQEKLSEALVELRNFKEDTAAAASRLEAVVLGRAARSPTASDSRAGTTEAAASTGRAHAMEAASTAETAASYARTGTVEAAAHATNKSQRNCELAADAAVPAPALLPTACGNQQSVPWTQLSGINGKADNRSSQHVDGSEGLAGCGGYVRQALTTWPADTVNRLDQGAGLAGAFRPPSTALQKQIELLNKEHMLAVSRFQQLQLLQENLGSARSPAAAAWTSSAAALSSGADSIIP